jgi:hypothetical protein
MLKQIDKLLSSGLVEFDGIFLFVRHCYHSQFSGHQSGLSINSPIMRACSSDRYCWRLSGITCDLCVVSARASLLRRLGGAFLGIVTSIVIKHTL